MPVIFRQLHVRPKASHRAQKVATHVVQPPDQNSARKRDFAKGLTPDVLQMFHDAQSNILELNKSRLQALEELKYARNRIQELEQTLKGVQEGSAPSDNGAPVYSQSFAPSTSQEAVAGYEAWAQRSVGNGAGPPPSQTKRQDVIRLLYASGWKKAFVHHRKNNEGWTKIPGMQMQRGTGEYDGLYVCELDANSIEFVLTNNENDWDTPDPNSNQKNYTIRSHGTYKLKSGRVHKMQ